MMSDKQTTKTKADTDPQGRLDALVRHGIIRKIEPVEGLAIKRGDLLCMMINDQGSATVALADDDHHANAQAAEDLHGPDVVWDYETGKVFNA
jgi:hypothetical protein